MKELRDGDRKMYGPVSIGTPSNNTGQATHSFLRQTIFSGLGACIGGYRLGINTYKLWKISRR